MSVFALASIWCTFMFGLIAAGVAAWHGDVHWTVTSLMISYVSVLQLEAAHHRGPPGPHRPRHRRVAPAMTAGPDLDDDLQLGLVMELSPVREPTDRCPTCHVSMHLVAGVVPLHPTSCPCLRPHPTGARCPFVTTCPGSHRRPR